MKSLKTRFERLAPPGVGSGRLVRWFFILLGGSFVWSLGFVLNYAAVFADPAYPMAVPDFAVLADDLLFFAGFPFAALCLLLCSALYLASFWRGSKAIYTMRRLPSRWELPKRCLALPALLAAAMLLAGVITLALWYALYFLATPKELLSPGQFGKLMGALGIL